jgi:DNA-directed RNA polymerase specialized sigma24 family protein
MLDRLLSLLDADRDRAGERYEAIRHRLVKFFTWHGAAYPDEMTDETFDRVMKRVDEGQEIQAADPVPYFFGVARNVLRESWRRQPHPEGAPSPTGVGALRPPSLADEAAEVRSDCLEQCLDRLAEPSRRLVLAYYRAGAGSVIAGRRDLAREMGLTLPALRLRIHRVRGRLEACVRECTSRVTEPGGGPPRSRRESS